MAQFIFLNEKSYGSAQTSPEAAQQALAAFSEAMVGVKRLLPNLSLLSSDRIGRLQLANGYSMSQWLNSGSEHREKARFLLTLANHAPFDTVVGLLHDADPGVTCYRCLGEPVEGIGLACLYGGMPVSLPIDEQWKTNTLSVDAEQILEDNSQSAWSTNVRHASLLQHVEDHRAWIVSLRRRDIANALDFSTRRLELFPFLAFTASTLKDIDKLEKPAFYQVMHYLSEMDDSVAFWNPSEAVTPEYPPNTTDESSSRKSLCRLPDIGGGHNDFTWHGRYTPGAGRMHFRLQASPKKVVFGYIGEKL